MPIEFDENNIPPALPDSVKAAASFLGGELLEFIKATKLGGTINLNSIHPRNFKPGTTKRSGYMLARKGKPRKPAPKTGLNRVLVDRTDAVLQAQLDADPIKFIQSEFSRSLLAEVMINRVLYSHETVDPSALTASNKRMVELADALKTLPKQNEGARGKNQKSSAELIEDAMDSYDPTANDTLRKSVESKALDRAAGSFDEDE